MTIPSHRYSGYVFDLDGIVYLGNALLPPLVKLLPLFCTNLTDPAVS
jgi:ribonucleotide monophosphatase NagD (HAD superfamily)